MTMTRCMVILTGASHNVENIEADKLWHRSFVELTKSSNVVLIQISVSPILFFMFLRWSNQQPYSEFSRLFLTIIVKCQRTAILLTQLFCNAECTMKKKNNIFALQHSSLYSFNHLEFLYLFICINLSFWFCWKQPGAWGALPSRLAHNINFFRLFAFRDHQLPRKNSYPKCERLFYIFHRLSGQKEERSDFHKNDSVSN